jgi:chloride channel protein, CIC family
LFAVEVISKRYSKTVFLSVILSSFTVWLFNLLLAAEPLFHIHASHWNYAAFPYFILLGIAAGLNAAYLTKAVLYIKAKFLLIRRNSLKIVSGSLFIGCCILIFPPLYGDGYHAMRILFKTPDATQWSLQVFFMFGGMLLFKPIITSVTLASGGDGGIFAPSLFIGAFLGLFVALILNYFFNAHVIPVNFMVIGMAAVLSASLHAPFTAVFLACGLVNNYMLVIPILTACIISKITAKVILPYTVYN